MTHDSLAVYLQDHLAGATAAIDLLSALRDQHAGDVDRQLAKGDLKFVLLGEKLSGSWVLVRTRGSRQWLLIKHKDNYASGEDLTLSKPLSIVSGRSMVEIGRAADASPRQLEQAAGADPVIPSVAPSVRRSAASTRRKAARRGGRSTAQATSTSASAS